MNLTAKIEWRDERGALSIDNARALHPFINVLVAARNGTTWKPALFLIDTGLSRTSVDLSLFAQLGVPVRGETELSGSGGVQKHGIYAIDLKFPEVPVGIAVDAVTMNHPLGDSGALGLLGMDILRMGRLVIEPPGGAQSYLQLVPASDRAIPQRA